MRTLTLGVFLFIASACMAQEVQVAPMAFYAPAVSSGPVVFDSAWSNPGFANTTRDTVLITVPTVVNGLLIAYVPIVQNSGNPKVDSVKFGTQKFVFVDSTQNQYTEENVWVYALVNPTAGAGNVIAYYNTTQLRPLMFVSLYHGANQGGGSSTFGARTKAYANSTSPSIAVASSSTNEVVYAGLFVTASTNTFTPGAGVTLRKFGYTTVATPATSGQTLEKAGASGNVTINGTLSGSERWILLGMAIKP